MLRFKNSLHDLDKCKYLEKRDARYSTKELKCRQNIVPTRIIGKWDKVNPNMQNAQE